ncbi:MAG: hypothetical protein ACYDCK_01120 [Thermoplasmatota archaeon]
MEFTVPFEDVRGGVASVALPLGGALGLVELAGWGAVELVMFEGGGRVAFVAFVEFDAFAVLAASATRAREVVNEAAGIPTTIATTSASAIDPPSRRGSNMGHRA